jgi:hypothetical protein
MSGSTPPFFIERFQLPSGAAMSGGKLYFFVAGSTTVPKNVFADYALTIPLTQPLVLDAAGNAPQYFMESGLYKILLKDATNVLQYTRDQIEGATSGGGTSALFQDSDSIHWTTVTDGGLTYNVGTVQTSAILDHKVLADATAGDVPGYLVAKFVDADGNPLTVNGAHQLVLPFARLDGAAFTGSVIVDGQLQSLGNTSLAAGPGATLLVSGPATMGIAAISDLKLPLLTPGDWLALDGAGNVVAVTPPSSDHKVLYDLSDAIPGFLGVKMQAGSGIQFNVTNDGVNGKVIHISVIALDLSQYLSKLSGGNVSGPIILSNPSVKITGVAGSGVAGNLLVDIAGNVSIGAPSVNTVISRFAILYPGAGVVDNTIGSGSVTCSGDITLGNCAYPNASNGMDVVVTNMSATSKNVIVPSGFTVMKAGIVYTGPTTIPLPSYYPIHLVGVTSGGSVGNVWAWL